MTTTFLESYNNDLVLSPDGVLAIAGEALAVGSDARSAIQAQRGEMLLAVADGMPTFDVAWSGWQPVQFEAAARAVLEAVPGVRSVESLTVSREGDVLRYHAVLSTDFGPVAIDA